MSDESVPPQEAAIWTAYLGDAAAYHALRRWAEREGARLVLPDVRWRRTGRYTGAELCTIWLRDRANLHRELLIKICSRTEGVAEDAGRAAIERDTPEFSRRRLVPQAYPGIDFLGGPLGGQERYILFWEVVGELRRLRTLGESEGGALTEGCRQLVLVMWRELNRMNERTGWLAASEPVPVREYLRAELGGALDAGTGRERADRLTGPNADRTHLTEDGRNLPDPVATVLNGSAADLDQITYLSGAIHADLHLDNVLVPYSFTGEPTFADLQLIDVGGYQKGAPLSHDIVTLLLSVVGRELSTRQRQAPGSGLQPNEASALIDLLLGDPHAVPPVTLPQILSEPILGVRQAAEEVLDGRMAGVWRRQYLLSLAGQALACLAYDDIGDAGHRWFLQLAARALEAFREEAGEPDPVVVPQPTPSPERDVPAFEPNAPSLVPDVSPDPRPLYEGRPGTALAALAVAVHQTVEDMLIWASLLPDALSPLVHAETPNEAIEAAREPREIVASLTDWLERLPPLGEPPFEEETPLPPGWREDWRKARADVEQALADLERGLPGDRQAGARLEERLADLQEAGRRSGESITGLYLLLLNASLPLHQDSPM
ncbi:hypothetical protein ACQEU3_08010 [Spirillospora sp. CA-253888]